MVKLSNEVCMHLGVSEEVKWLEDTLRSIKDRLAEADNSSLKDDAVRAWSRKLKDVMYEATDILDVCEIKGDKRGAHLRTNPVALCLPFQGHKIRRQVKALRKKVDEILTEEDVLSPTLSSEKNFRPTRVISDEDEKIGAIDSRLISRPVFQPTEIVGIDHDKKIMLDMLINEGILGMTGENICVVAVVGMGGIGKTTLAQIVFNDSMIQVKFDTRIWISISQSFNIVNLLKSVIHGLGADHGGTKDMAILQHIIFSEVRGKKIFLVLDDMWDPVAWEILRLPLMGSAQEGSRVLITTRNELVARQVRAARVHSVTASEHADALVLFKNQMVTSATDEVDIEEVAMKILAKCKGLPISIIKILTIALVLHNRNRITNEWEKILESFSQEANQENQISNVFFFSYAQLPFDLKQCLLHCSLFPRDYVISCDKVVQMWIAEALVQANENSMLPEVLGMEYYKKLVLRCFFEHVDEYDGQGHYRMHDLLHSLAQKMVKSEALVVQDEQIIHSGPLSEIRRLFLSTTEEVEWSVSQTLHSLRTLIIIGNVIVKAATDKIFSTLSGLRILHVNNNADVHVLLNSLHHMRHLRYLDLSFTDVCTLPDGIGKMKFLQYICLQGCKNFVQLPKSIVELLKLRYLNISGTKIKSIPEEGFCGLKNLVSLQGFPSQVGSGDIKDWCSLGELRHMSQLMHLTIEGLENCSSASMASDANIGKKMNLAYLRLSCTGRLSINGEVDKMTVKEVFDELCPPPNLKELIIKGYFGRQFPSWLISTKLMKLRVLKLENLVMCNQLPSTLWQLPCLEHLCIKHALNVKRIGHEFLLQSSLPGSREALTEVAETTKAAAAGGGSAHNRGPCDPSGSVDSREEEIVVESTTEDAATTTEISSAIGFPKLKKLVLYGLMKWKQWDWADQVESMPLLENMHISWCLLNQLPPGLASQARSLNVLVLDNVKNLVSIEDFPSAVELSVSSNFKLERISNLRSMQRLTVSKCPKLNVLQHVPAVQSIELSDHDMETLPEYFRDLPEELSHLQISCTLSLLTLISRGEGSPEWEKIKHIQEVKAYADSEEDNIDKWLVFYTRKNKTTETNIKPSTTPI